MVSKVVEAVRSIRGRIVDRALLASTCSTYVVHLVFNMQRVLRRHGALDKLRFLLYPSNLTQADAAQLRRHGEGIVWLGKE